MMKVSSSDALMKKWVLLLLVLLCTSRNCLSSEEREIYLVLMEGEAAAFHRESEKEVANEGPSAHGHAQRLIDSHDQLLRSTLDSGSYNKLHSFKHIVNGFSIHTTPSQVEKVKKAPGVKLVEKDKRAKLMTTYTPEFLGLPKVWTQEGGARNAGEGIVIGVVDTGINPLHPSFANDPANTFTPNLSHFSGTCEVGPLFPGSSCNGKIVSARFFSAGAQATGVLNTSNVDLLSPFDAVGHGSHVASTAAGNFGVPVVVDGFYYGRASGMAPRARIAVYKAVYPSVGTLTDVLAATDQAVLDGVDIITISLGPVEPPQGTITLLGMFDIFMLAAQRAGVFVVQSVGNRGPGPYSVSSYSPWAVGVASCDIDRSYPGTLVLGNGQKIGGVGLSGPTSGYGMLQHKLVFTKDAVKINETFPQIPQYTEECQHPEALEPAMVKDSIVICSFSAGFLNGTSSLLAIIKTAKILGFRGFAFIANPAFGDFIAEPIPFSVPGILIPRTSDAQILLRYYEQHTLRALGGVAVTFSGTAAITEGRTASYMKRAPVVSRFSSRGPDFIDLTRKPTDLLKPDILAPGHQIWGAWSPMSAKEPLLSGYSFALLSGTSMAAPHIAGIAALIKQKKPSWSPSTIASALGTTAIRYDNLGDRIMAEGFRVGYLYPSTPFGFGAGLVNPTKALDPGLIFPAGYEDYISFLCSLPNANPAIIRTATGGGCDRSFNRPSDLNVPSITISSLTGSRIVHRSVKNMASKPETYLCAVFPPNGVKVEIQPSWFTIAQQGTQDLQIKLNVTQAQEDFSFGEIVFTGSLDHIVRMPLSVFPLSVL